MTASVPSSADATGTGQRAITALRLAFVVIGVVALVLGYIGLDQYLAKAAPQSRDPLNLLYGDLQLFVLGADPLEDATEFPLALQIARFAAPAVTLFALTEAGRVLLASELRRLRARRARGHAIVCGDSTAARTLADRLHRADQRVVAVRSGPIGPLELRRRSLLGVSGDASDPDVLRGAGAAQATVIYACSEDSATNVAIATAAGRVLGETGGRATVYALIHDPERATALQARRLGVDAAPGLRLDFFNFDSLAVRVLLAQRPLEPRGRRAPRLLVAGDSPFARALLVEIARTWRLRRGPDHPPAEVDLVAPGATDMLRELALRYVILGEACRIVPYDTDVPGVLSRHDDEYDQAYLCYRDEEYGLQVALTSYRLWHRVHGSVLVPVDRLAGLTDAFREGDRLPLLDEVHGRIRLFPKVTAACDPALIAEDLVERLARLIHERYVIGCRDRGEQPADPAALADWDRLDDERRRANRSQAVSIGAKLHAIGCTIVARSGPDDFAMSDDEVERLAEAEHRRWAAEAEALGWRYGPVRDQHARLSPYLRDWADLPGEQRAKDRAAVRDIPAILADAGFQVVRIDDPVGEREAHLVDRL